MVVHRHYRGRREGRDRRLADSHHMRARANMLEVAHNIVDVFVEIEAPVCQWNILRIGPIGDVNHTAFEHALDRAAQQGRIVAAHRRNDQQTRGIGGQTFVRELPEIAERLVDLHRLVHSVRHAVDLDYLKPKGGLGARRSSMSKDLERGREHLGAAETGPGILRIAEHLGAHGCHGAARVQQRALDFIGFVEHCEHLLIVARPKSTSILTSLP